MQQKLSPVCSYPLVYLNCSSAPKGTKGVECQKSCHTLDMDCVSKHGKENKCLLMQLLIYTGACIMGEANCENCSKYAPLSHSIDC